MSLERGTGGKNSNYGWANREEAPEDSVVAAWLAALWAKPFTWTEYEEQRRLAASRNAVKQAGAGEKVHRGRARTARTDRPVSAGQDPA